MSYSSVVRAALSGQTVIACVLARFSFNDGQPDVRLALCPTSITRDGYTWIGTGGLLNIEGLQRQVGTSAPVVTVTLSGLDSRALTAAINASSTVKGYPAYFYYAFFDERLQPIGELVPIFSGLMDQVTYSANGPQSVTLSLTVETYMAGRGQAPYALLSDAHQQALYSGDRFLERANTTHVVYWPV